MAKLAYYRDPYQSLLPSRKKIKDRGNIFYWFIVLTTIVAAVGKISIFDFKLSGFVWLTVSAVSAIALFLFRQKKIDFPFAIWIPFLVYILLRTDLTDREDLQRFVILLTPVLAGAAISSLVFVRLSNIRISYYVSLWILIAIYGFSVAKSGSRLGNTEWFVPHGICMTLTLISVAGSVDYGQGNIRGVIAVCICWVMSLLTESRTAVFVIPIIFVLTTFQLSMSKKTLFSVIFIIAGFYFFYSEPVQTNLFRKGYGSIEDLLEMDPRLLHTGGRLTAWPVFLENIPNIWFGGGGTASADFGNSFFRGWSHPHNEYIRILFDYGIIGAVLILVPIGYLFYKCHILSRKASGDIQWLFNVGKGGIIAMLLLGISGNVLMYVVWFGNLLFSTIGLAFTVYANRKNVLPAEKKKNCSFKRLRIRW